MASVNKAILLGNLGRDPEVRYTPAGQAVTSFSIATTEVRKNKDGEKTEYTEWHKIVAWGRLGEICGEYLSKGKSVYIEGQIRTREWEDKEGNKRWTTEIVANNMQMLGSPGGGGGARDSSKSSKSEEPTDMGGEPFGSDDVPF